jgi:DNA-binding response OmpR family regulator
MNINPKKIMIADDDPDIVDAIGLMLTFEGYHVSSTYRGSDVLRLNGELPDLLLLDIQMPGEDGRDICRQFKANKYTKQIPVIMISASFNVKSSALESGADDFLAKPFDMADLISKIQKYTHT